jgi:hypothetical protein
LFACAVVLAGVSTVDVAFGDDAVFQGVFVH